MSNEMIERVAKVLYKLHFKKYDTRHTIFNNLLETHKIYWYEIARAAIKAMREPTDEMFKNCNSCLAYGEIEQIYQAMIDAALNEKT